MTCVLSEPLNSLCSGHSLYTFDLRSQSKLTRVKQQEAYGNNLDNDKNKAWTNCDTESHIINSCMKRYPDSFLGT